MSRALMDRFKRSTQRSLSLAFVRHLRLSITLRRMLRIQGRTTRRTFSKEKLVVLFTVPARLSMEARLDSSRQRLALRGIHRDGAGE